MAENCSHLLDRKVNLNAVGKTSTVPQTLIRNSVSQPTQESHYELIYQLDAIFIV